MNYAVSHLVSYNGEKTDFVSCNGEILERSKLCEVVQTCFGEIISDILWQ